MAFDKMADSLGCFTTRRDVDVGYTYENMIGNDKNNHNEAITDATKYQYYEYWYSWYEINRFTFEEVLEIVLDDLRNEEINVYVF